ncbi:ArsR/SmtB family transcription factor [Halomicrococcus gelatinilyticus]|uniref:ArsR/SmtB family transcription factor n=1 Tax=Halomicrococcus gelatinilyticus TaxID=1702103 RepID=UPI002E0F6919
MAIPHWLWPHEEQDGATTPEPADLARASTTFEALSDENRLGILTALADSAEPLSYTDLRAASPVDDNGKLNYHLRRLDDDGLLVRQDGAYALSDRGATLVETVDAAVAHEE